MSRPEGPVSFDNATRTILGVKGIMKAYRSVLLVTAIATTLTACSYLTGDDGMFRDRQGDYLASPVIPPMSIPETLDSYTLDALYVVPDEIPVDKPFFIEAPAPRPMDTSVREGVVVQRFGDRRWIVIGAEPGQVWPRLRDYWSTAQIPLSAEDPIAAIMETAWLGEPGSRNKYQVRIEPGLHSGNSEIYVVQVGEAFVADVNAPLTWPTRSADLEVESRMLDDISVYLADRTDLYRASSVSLLAGSIEAESKANIVRTGTGDTLQLRIDFDRAWSQVSQALGNAEIEIASSERTAATIAVRYSPIAEEDQPGFFGRLFGGGEDADLVPVAITLRLLQEEGHIAVVAEAAEDVAVETRDALIRSVHTNLI
jgi:outer membrane protein assembly factor BamC